MNSLRALGDGGDDGGGVEVVEIGRLTVNKCLLTETDLGLGFNNLNESL